MMTMAVLGVNEVDVLGAFRVIASIESVPGQVNDDARDETAGRFSS